jgi:hypothetical protein
MKQVKLHPNVDRMLSEISKQRKEAGRTACSKQAVVAQLIIDQHKREVK